MNIEMLSSKFALDEFTIHSLQADVTWSITEFVPGMFFLVLLICTIILFIKNKLPAGIMVLSVGCALLLNLFLLFFIGKIEHYSQRSPIEFYKKYEGQPVEIKTLGFHSYAPFFYAQKPLPGSNRAMASYFVIKKGNEELINMDPSLRILYEENGFIFLQRQ
jgi:hypothetical protein